MNRITISRAQKLIYLNPGIIVFDDVEDIADYIYINNDHIIFFNDEILIQKLPPDSIYHKDILMTFSTIYSVQ